MAAMSRTTVLVLVALGAAIAGFAFSTAARRGEEETAAGSGSAAATAQHASLGWRESHGAAGERLVFSVDTLEVLRNGWRAKVSLENQSSASYEVVSTLERPFGLMIFSSGSIEELDELNRKGELPTVRQATRYEPRLPAVLEPGDTWSGTISAPGALVAGGWARVVFGALVRIAPPHDGVSWITDHVYRLES